MSAETSVAGRGIGAWAGQVVLYVLFAAVLGLFSRWPVYHHLPPDTALVKLSMVHAGQPVSARVRVPAATGRRA